MNIDKELISGLVYPDYDKDMSQYDKMRLLESIRHQFGIQSKPTIEFIKTHFDKFNKVPSPETINEKFPALRLKEPSEPYRFYLNEAVQMRVLKDVQNAIQEVERKMSTGSTKEAVETFISAARKFEIVDVTSKDVNMKEYMPAFIQEYLEKQSEVEEGEEVIGLSVGLPTIDKMTGGMLPGDYWTLVGRPGSMKSYTLCKFAVEFADQMDGKILFVSKEMTSEHIFKRMVSVAGEESFSKLKRYQIDKDTLERMDKKIQKIKGNIIITDEVHDFNGIRPKVMEHDAKLVIVDGLYLFAKNDDWREVAMASRALRSVALNLNIPAISSVQFNRKGGKSMHGDNIAFTDAIQQDASVILGQERIYDEVAEKYLNMIRMKILKSRDDVSGGEITVSLDFNKSLFIEGENFESEPWSMDKVGSMEGLNPNEMSSV
jgi:replicative DNA helicase